MKKIVILTITIMTLLSCSNVDCEGVYNIPSQNFTFEIVDKINGENLFTNETYNPEQIQIINTVNNLPIELTFISENNINHILINSASWETEVVNLKINISDNHIFSFHSDGELIIRECFSYTQHNEVRIENSDFELNTQTGVYKILVE